MPSAHRRYMKHSGTVPAQAGFGGQILVLLAPGLMGHELAYHEVPTVEASMADPIEHRLTIFDFRTPDDEHHTLTAIVKPTGELALEGYDIGKSVEEFFDDADYEYWRTVKAEHVPEVLLHLIKDRFQSESDFAAWLKEKGIPSEFFSYV